MKKILFSFTILVITGYSTRLMAQCSEASLNATIKTVTSTPGGCQVTMDISFTGNFNNGSKYAFIHLWESSPVNNYPNLSYNSPPTAAQLATAVTTIVIADPGSNSAALYNQYVPDPSVPVSSAGVGFSKSGATYTLTDVVITLPTCNQAVTVTGDIWSSQANDAQVVHCFNQGAITLLLNSAVITGVKLCATPRLLNLTFTNTDATLSEAVVPSVFIDVNSNGIVDAGDIDITNSLSPALPNPINLPANSSQSFNGMSYLPYSNQTTYDSEPIIVMSTVTAPGASPVTNTKNNIDFLGTCSLLPVTLKSFTATRDRSTVVLKWETAFEQNNVGFAVEYNNSGVWKQLAFVPSQAAGGNSSNVLSYQYFDLNMTKGVTQYRIRQVDIDSRFTYSEIKIVRGEQQPQKTLIYPNPSNNGQLNIVFEESTGPRDVSLTDMSGRIVRQWRNVNTNNIHIDNLGAGMYNLRVVIRASGEQEINKIIVTAR